MNFDISSDPSSLDPLFLHSDSGGTEAELARLAFEPFFDVDEHGRLVPALVTAVPTKSNGGISRDGRVITYHLRHVRWTDGVDVTSADVLFTLAQIMDSDNPVESREGYDRIVSATAPDAHTVVFMLREAWSPSIKSFFAYSATPQFVLPKHVLESQLPLKEAPFSGSPTVGDGPYDFLQVATRREHHVTWLILPTGAAGREWGASTSTSCPIRTRTSV